jgi:hypothetical protein
MTDAAVSVTQSAVEQFTEQYLTTVGCHIEKDGSRWEVIVTDEADTELGSGNLVLVCEDDPSKIEEGAEPLHPESTFFQDLVTEAIERNPTGKIVIGAESTQVEVPSWLENSRVDVDTANFSPYYDRTAVVLLYRISIETVSEYQQEMLRAVALDLRSTNHLPSLEDTFLQFTSPTNESEGSKPLEIDKERVSHLVDEGGETVVNQVQPQIDEVHQEASRAADAEVEEYRRMQQQRIEELEEEASNIASRIEELSQSIQDSNDQETRVQSLKKRKELKSEYNEIESELTDVQQRREHGFPDKQKEIRDRHALEVVVTPITITQVEYERGEIEFKLTDETGFHTMTVGYGSGIGVTEEVYCDSCNRQLAEQNPIQTVDEGIQCKTCSSNVDSEPD